MQIRTCEKHARSKIKRKHCKKLKSFLYYLGIYICSNLHVTNPIYLDFVDEIGQDEDVAYIKEWTLHGSVFLLALLICTLRNIFCTTQLKKHTLERKDTLE